MASLMDDLLEVLHKEDEQYQKLIALSEQKTQALVAAKIQEIQEIAEAEQGMVEVIQRCEKDCDGIIKDMGIVLGRDMESLTVTELIRMLEKQPAEQQRLQEAYDRLIETAKKMKTCNERNRVLVNQALEMVEFDLTLYRSMRMAPETANYGKDATNTATAQGVKGAGRFDQKQ